MAIYNHRAGRSSDLTLFCWLSRQVELKCMSGMIPQRKKQGENTKSWINVFGEEKKRDFSQRILLAQKTLISLSTYLSISGYPLHLFRPCIFLSTSLSVSQLLCLLIGGSFPTVMFESFLWPLTFFQCLTHAWICHMAFFIVGTRRRTVAHTHPVVPKIPWAPLVFF